MIRALMLLLSPIEILRKAWDMSWLTKILFLVLAYLEPIKNLYHLAMMAVVINFIVGWYKSRVVNREQFNPTKAWHTIEKIGIFTIYIVIVYMFEHVILGTDTYYTTRVLAGILVLAELKSISENGDKIIGQRIFSGLYRGLRRAFDSRYAPKEEEAKEDI